MGQVIGLRNDNFVLKYTVSFKWYQGFLNNFHIYEYIGQTLIKHSQKWVLSKQIGL